MSDSNYIISIDKDAMHSMPLMNFPGRIIVIDSTAEALAAIRVLSKEKMVGFDTETRPSFRKGCSHKVALMQISTEDTCFLFRLNILGISEQLKEFLENPAVTKIGLSVHDDFNVLRRSSPELDPQGFVDLQAVVKDFEITDISLQKICAIIFGQRVSKGQRLSNWEADKLSDPQQAYAALDAWACLKIYDYLNEGRFNPLASPYRHKQEPLPPAAS